MTAPCPDREDVRRVVANELLTPRRAQRPVASLLLTARFEPRPAVDLRPEPEAFLQEVHQRGRNEVPGVLFFEWHSGGMSRATLRRVILDVWQTAEFPAALLGTAAWVELFRAAGFIDRDKELDDEEAPTEPITAYRGTTLGRRRGMSWTTDRTQALWFANRCALTGGEAHIFKVAVPHGVLLAFYGDDEAGRGEHEVVVDPVLLPPIGRKAIVASMSR